MDNITEAQDDQAIAHVNSGKRRQEPLSEMSRLEVAMYPNDPGLAADLQIATGCEDPAAGAIFVEQAALVHPAAPKQSRGATPDPPTVAANQVRQLMAEIAPEDGLQATIATELVAWHCLSMEILRGVQERDCDPLDPGIRVAERIARLTARQAEVLGNLRRGGKQVVTVRREQVVIERHDDGSETRDRRTVEARGDRG